MLRRALFAAVLLAAATIAPPASSAPKALITTPPRLVIVVVIDQLRADHLRRFRTRFLAAGRGRRPGGFRFLMERGAYFPAARIDVTQALTAVGHATIATGAYPYRSGIVANEWFDRSRRRIVYCTEDARHRVVSSGGAHAKQPRGTSPANLWGPTIGDAMKNAGYPSKVAAVALKDRAAILLGGRRADAAIWFDKYRWRWVTSTFYVGKRGLPPWVARLNERHGKNVGRRVRFPVEGPGVGFSDDTPSRPARFVVKTGERGALHSPLAPRLTTDAAIAAVDALSLGRDDHPDLLAVSYASLDMVGHQHGPNRREVEEQMVAIDRSLARLFAHAARRVKGGLQRTLIVLTSDHGVSPAAPYLKARRTPARALDHRQLAGLLSDRLTKRFGAVKGQPWIAHAAYFNIYLNPKALAAKNMRSGRVEAEVARGLRALPFVRDVVTRTEVAQRKYPPGRDGVQLRNAFAAARSGDVIAIAHPYVVPTIKDRGVHGSGYAYDTTVPLLFAGAHVKAGIHATGAELIDIAPTIALFVGSVPPALSEGRVLSEVFGARHAR